MKNNAKAFYYFENVVHLANSMIPRVMPKVIWLNRANEFLIER